MINQDRIHLEYAMEEINELSAELRDAVDALRQISNCDGRTQEGWICANIALPIVAAYDAKHPEGECPKGGCASLPTIESMSGLVDDFTDGKDLREYLEDISEEAKHPEEK